MPLKRQHRVVAHHAQAVVGDLNQPLASPFDFDAQPRRTGVERVFEEFLGHRSRAFDHLTSGDLIRHDVAKNVDSGHK